MPAFVMKTYKFGNIVVTLNNDGQIVETTGVTLSEEQKAHVAACISLALAQHAQEELHDDENVREITVKTHETPWNNPQRQFRK